MSSNRIVKPMIAALAVTLPAAAQQLQIPTIDICNSTSIAASALVQIGSRTDAQHAGTFRIEAKVTCSAQTRGIPTGTVTISELQMSDSTASVAIKGTTVEQLTSVGKHTPMAFLNGRCDWHGTPCRYWMLLTDNRQERDKGTRDIAAFVVLGTSGERLAYGAGPVSKGDIEVSSGQ